PSSDDGKKVDKDPKNKNECNDQEKEDNVNSINNVNTVITAGTNGVNAIGENISIELQFEPNMPALEDVSTFNFSSDDEDDGAVADIKQFGYNNTNHLGKFDGKADEDFFVGYSLNSKAFRVFNSKTRIVEENLHIRFSESTPNIVGNGPDWLFDIDALTRTINYEPIVA
nr:ribonuclease H-like domain-containing protein [Tanacetum cinerariifolium]